MFVACAAAQQRTVLSLTIVQPATRVSGRIAHTDSRSQSRRRSAALRAVSRQSQLRDSSLDRKSVPSPQAARSLHASVVGCRDCVSVPPCFNVVLALFENPCWISLARTNGLGTGSFVHDFTSEDLVFFLGARGPSEFRQAAGIAQSASCASATWLWLTPLSPSHGSHLNFRAQEPPSGRRRPPGASTATCRGGQLFLSFSKLHSLCDRQVRKHDHGDADLRSSTVHDQPLPTSLWHHFLLVFTHCDGLLRACLGDTSGFCNLHSYIRRGARGLGRSEWANTCPLRQYSTRASCFGKFETYLLGLSRLAAHLRPLRAHVFRCLVDRRRRVMVKSWSNGGEHITVVNLFHVSATWCARSPNVQLERLLPPRQFDDFAQDVGPVPLECSLGAPLPHLFYHWRRCQALLFRRLHAPLSPHQRARESESSRVAQATIWGNSKLLHAQSGPKFASSWYPHCPKFASSWLLCPRRTLARDPRCQQVAGQVAHRLHVARVSCGGSGSGVSFVVCC